jgi:hypothetical protein
MLYENVFEKVNKYKCVGLKTESYDENLIKKVKVFSFSVQLVTSFYMEKFFLSPLAESNMSTGY